MSMMNVKQSTKAFGDVRGTQNVNQGGGLAEYTPEDLKKLGGENVGEVP